MQLTLSDVISITNRITVLEMRMASLEKPKATRRLETRDIIQVVFGVAVLIATIVGKISWVEAFANLRLVIGK